MIRIFLLSLLAPLSTFAQEAAPIPEGEYRLRQEKLRKQLKGGVGILDTAELSPRPGSDRNTPLFDFKYLTGFHDPEGILILTPKKTIVFITDTKRTGTSVVDFTYDRKSFSLWIEKHLPGCSSVQVSLRNPETDQKVKTSYPGRRKSLGREITRLRLIKSPEELRLMRKAATATVQAHNNIMEILKPGIREKVIQEKIETTYRENGCPELCFPSICGSGKNGTILHYRENAALIPENSLIVCDIGASVENYGTDITRTYPTSGKFTQEQRKAYSAVLAAQKAAEKSLKPGTTLLTLHRISANHMADAGWKKWSFGHGEAEDIRHGVGHFVGMTVHDSGEYRTVLKPGMVITLEPGWYDREAEWGIRIEDIYLVTVDGFERMSRGAPREIIEIEKIMAQSQEKRR